MNYKKHTQLSGFTLVELVVVATILVILSAIGFSAYTSYIDGARDSNRIVELSNIRSGLQSVATKGSLPLPTDSVTINNGVEILGYQGYAGADVLENIDLKKGGKDPLDDTYYSYYLTKSRNHFQLLGFLENESTAYSSLPVIETRASDFDYSLRYPTVTGESLGIMVGTGAYTNIPIQELDEVTSGGVLDVSTTLVEYTAIIKDDYTVSGNNTALSVVASLANSGGKIGQNCKDLVDSNPGLVGKDGTYLISPDGVEKFEVECDMTTDGGGWTQIKTTAGGWMPDDKKLMMPDATEILFDYNSNVTGTLVDHKYKISKFVALGDGTTASLDDGQEITSSTHMINIILGKSPNTGYFRGNHYGDVFEFRGENVGPNYDECHDDEDIYQENYRIYSHRFYKNHFYLHGGHIGLWGGGSQAHHGLFQTRYCVGGPSGSNVIAYEGNRTDIYIR